MTSDRDNLKPLWLVRLPVVVTILKQLLPQSLPDNLEGDGRQSGLRG